MRLRYTNKMKCQGKDIYVYIYTAARFFFSPILREYKSHAQRDVERPEGNRKGS